MTPTRILGENWRLDTANRLWGPEGDTRLHPQHVRLLEALAKAPNSTISSEQLRVKIWHGKPVANNNVKVLICRTRIMFREVGAKDPIINVWGEGYMLSGHVGCFVTHDFTTDEWSAVQECVRFAGRHMPDLKRRTGL